MYEEYTRKLKTMLTAARVILTCAQVSMVISCGNLADQAFFSKEEKTGKVPVPKPNVARLSLSRSSLLRSCRFALSVFS